jgi:hypothetical protein
VIRYRRSNIETKGRGHRKVRLRDEGRGGGRKDKREEGSMRDK